LGGSGYEADHSDVKKVLVTGGTGFIGSHVIEALLKRGYSVTCLVRDPSNLKWLSGMNIDVVRGDCMLPESLIPAVQGVSMVVHAAGLTKAKWAREYYEVNKIGTHNILNACMRHNAGLEKFILVSSLAAAGPSRDGNPLREQDAPSPVSDYGKSKLLAEQEVLNYKDLFPVVILRPSAVYGPRDRDLFEIFRWASRGMTLEIRGKERLLNFCYVGDLVQAIVLTLEKGVPSGNIYFVAENRPYSWSQFREILLTTGEVKTVTIKIPKMAAYLIGLVSELGSLFTSRPALMNRQKIREAVQQYWICDLDKIEKDFGFKSVFPLQQGLSSTWRWYRDNGWLQ
jgi:nucleoside-diphosphate-sugar epimerase